MSESIIKALLQLFAIVANFTQEGVTGKGRTIVESYLKQFLNQELLKEYLAIFDQYYILHHKTKSAKKTSANSVKVLKICNQINEELRQEQKVLVLLQLIEFISYGEKISSKELEFVKTVSDIFNIEETEFLNCKTFILDTIEDIPEKNKILIIDKKPTYKHLQIKHIQSEHLNGKIIVLQINSTNMYAFKYIGNDNLLLNGQSIQSNWGYIFGKGSAISSHKIPHIYYSDIVGKFLDTKSYSNIVFTAKDIEFRYKNSTNGIRKFTFSEQTGRLIGIMGGSGAGKSTLLNIFNGNYKPQKGQILINGHDIQQEKEKLQGIIGFIPQNDLLIEELTVYQNLYFNAKLCFNKYSEKQIHQVVKKILLDLDLFDIRDLEVGGPLNKFISGGQRKRLNIALELIREPAVLFVDEPTSGLSSMDSEMVMDLLKEQTLKGKLVIVNIHQPSSDIYKMFDRTLFLDKGGYPIFYGNPLEAVVYFKKLSNFANAKESECITCGNVNTEQILQIIEAKVVNEYGKLTRNRKVAPHEWYEAFQKNIQPRARIKQSKEDLPKSSFNIPGKIKQFTIFTFRDILSKFTDKQYLLITLLEAPALAFILGYFSKYIAGTSEDPNKYIFSLNENMPGYLFMSVVVALFLGLIVSAEEIIKDRKILQRETFLNLSRWSYLNSKVLIIFIISAIQTLSFVIIGNYILEIKEMTMSYFLILFSTSCFANMLGLNISSALKSVVTIYILVPFILVPQLLLSGTIVNFDKLHKSLASQKFVPTVSDVMTSRWAYEALVVQQFKNNEFNKHFFDINKKISNSVYKSTFLITKLKQKIDRCERNIENHEKEYLTRKDLNILTKEILKLNKELPDIKFDQLNDLNIISFNSQTAESSKKYLSKVKRHFQRTHKMLNYKKDETFSKLLKKYSKEEVDDLKKSNHNTSLSDIALNKKDVLKITEDNNELIRKYEPIYMTPASNFGRAHFFSNIKILGSLKIDTFWFNIAVIWFTTIILYLTLIFNIFKRTVDYLEGIKLFKTE